MSTKLNANSLKKAIQQASNPIIYNKNDGSSISYNHEEDLITIDHIFNNNTPLRKMDRWMEKTLLGDPNTKRYTKRPYPYKNYHKLDEVVRVYGKELIKKLVELCPHIPKHKKHLVELQEDVIDSLSWTIWDKRLDPKSIMPDIPEFGSLWDRISEDGYEKK